MNAVAEWSKARLLREKINKNYKIKDLPLDWASFIIKNGLLSWSLLF